MTAVLPLRRWVLDLGATVVLLTVAIIGFWPTFAGPVYLLAAVGGAVLGIAVAVVGAWRRWGILILAALTIGVYFVFGAALALPHTAILGFIPSLESLRQLAVGVVTSWKSLLTTVAPVAASDGHLLVPFLLCLVAGVLTASLALRVHPPAWALLPAAALLATQIALGTTQPAAPLVQGLIFAIVAIVWLAVRQAWQPARAAISLGEAGGASSAGLATRRVVAGAVVLAIAATAGVATAALAAANEPRYVLRDVVIPPFDVRQYPSPMQSFRAYVRDFPDEPLFTASGLPEGARIRLATMDAYDGTVINVADEGTGSSSAFTPVRGNMSAEATGTPVTIHVEVDGLDTVWLPDAGSMTSVSFDGDGAEQLRRTAYYNEATGTAVVTAGIERGVSYTFDALLPAVPSDEQLADREFAPVRTPEQESVPTDFAEIASDLVADATTPIEQARALQQALSQDGFFSHGLEGQVLSRAGHGAERISTLLTGQQMIGDDEQYAVAMALLADQLGMPARVVMGFYPDEDQTGPVFTATGESLHAWVEIAFDGFGWVPFDPTPPEDQVPNDQTTKPRADPKPQVLQPPPPEQQPVDLPPTVPDERGSEDEDNNIASVIGLVLLIILGVLVVLAILLAPFVVIGGLKAARRRRRLSADRTADRISGGWEELLDRSSDYGAPVRPGGTRAEDAAVVGPAFAEPQVATLARRADAEVFGPSDPTPEDVDEFWREVDGIVGGMRQKVSFWRRVRAHLDVRSLLAGTRFALPEPRRRVAKERVDAAEPPVDSAGTADAAAPPIDGGRS